MQRFRMLGNMAERGGKRSALACLLLLCCLACLLPVMAFEARLSSQATLQHNSGVSQPSLRRILKGAGGGGGHASGGHGRHGAYRRAYRGAYRGKSFGGGHRDGMATAFHTRHNAEHRSYSGWTFLMAIGMVLFELSHLLFLNLSL